MRQLAKIMTTSLLFSTLALAQPQGSSPSPAEIERRAESLLGRMTIEEKIDMLGGGDGFFIREFPHLGIPRMKMADGPLGVRNFGPATAFAGGIALAATWNPQLAGRVGTELGRDARARALSYYDTSAKQWRAHPGDFEVLVGRSPERIELRGKLTLD